MAVQSGTYRGVSAEDRAAERRGRLLEATLTVWSEPDAKVTMTRICAEAGLTERYFYESFTGLDDALATLLDQVADEIEAASLAATEAAGPEPVERVRASVSSLLELLEADPRKGRVALVEAQAHPTLRHRRTDLLRRFARLAAEEAREHYGRTGWGPAGGEVAGLLYVGGLAELVTAWLDHGVEASPAEIVDAAAAMFLGLHVEPGPAAPSPE